MFHRPQINQIPEHNPKYGLLRKPCLVSVWIDIWFWETNHFYPICIYMSPVHLGNDSYGQPINKSSSWTIMDRISRRVQIKKKVNLSNSGKIFSSLDRLENCIFTLMFVFFSAVHWSKSIVTSHFLLTSAKKVNYNVTFFLRKIE